MTQEMKAGDRQIKAFEASLTKIVGAENFPREALGDLSLLLDTLRRSTRMLTGLMELRPAVQRDPAVKLHELEIVLRDDLRSLLKAVLPVLKELTKVAYAAREKKADDDRDVKRLLKKLNALKFERIALDEGPVVADDEDDT